MDDKMPPWVVEGWEEFPLDAEMNGCLCPAVFQSPRIFPLQRPRELRWMLEKSGSPRVVYEIGADKAGGLYHWCRLPSVERVIACEFRGTPYSREFERLFPWLDFLWLPQSSYDQTTVRKVEEWLAGDRINALFIDGDKSHFVTDFDAYVPLMSKPGVVFFHDIQDEAPGTAFRELCRRGYAHAHHVDTQDTAESLERAAQNIPAANPHEGWMRHWRGRSCGVGMIEL